MQFSRKYSIKSLNLLKYIEHRLTKVNDRLIYQNDLLQFRLIRFGTIFCRKFRFHLI